MLVSSIGHFDVKNTVNATSKRKNSAKEFGHVSETQANVVPAKKSPVAKFIASIRETFSNNQQANEKSALFLIG